MKNFAMMILLTVMLAIWIQPLVDLANIMREKIILSSAVTNACRASKDRSLKYEDFKDLDATVDEDKFVEYFSQAFCDAFGATRISKSGTPPNHEMVFHPTNNNFNDMTVKLNFQNDSYSSEEKATTQIHVTLETRYQFKTKFLRQADQAGMSGGPCIVKCDQIYLMSVRN